MSEDPETVRIKVIEAHRVLMDMSDRRDIEAILARNFDLAQSAVRLVSWSRLH